MGKLKLEASLKPFCFRQQLAAQNPVIHFSCKMMQKRSILKHCIVNSNRPKPPAHFTNITIQQPQILSLHTGVQQIDVRLFCFMPKQRGEHHAQRLYILIICRCQYIHHSILSTSFYLFFIISSPLFFGKPQIRDRPTRQRRKHPTGKYVKPDKNKDSNKPCHRKTGASPQRKDD